MLGTEETPESLRGLLHEPHGLVLAAEVVEHVADLTNCGPDLDRLGTRSPPLDLGDGPPLDFALIVDSQGVIGLRQRPADGNLDLGAIAETFGEVGCGAVEGLPERDGLPRGSGLRSGAGQDLVREEVIDGLCRLDGEMGGLLIGLGPSADAGLGGPSDDCRISGAFGRGLAGQCPIAVGEGPALGELGADGQADTDGRGRQRQPRHNRRGHSRSSRGRLGIDGPCARLAAGRHGRIPVRARNAAHVSLRRVIAERLNSSRLTPCRIPSTASGLARSSHPQRVDPGRVRVGPIDGATTTALWWIGPG